MDDVRKTTSNKFEKEDLFSLPFRNKELFADCITLFLSVKVS